MRRTFTCRPSTKRPVKAATAADMLDAFQDRIAELSVEFKTDVSCSSDESTDFAQARTVKISDEDYNIQYEDVEGGFGEPGSVYTLAEIKDFWNRENQNDPVLTDYPSYSSWWRDTLSNFLREV